MSNLLGVGRTEGGQGGQSVQLLMSLFLILLCFFVLLVGHSASRKDRSQAALGSVNQAFGGVSRDIAGTPAPVVLPDGLTTIVQDLRARLSDGAGAVSLVEGGGEAVLRAIVPRATLFDRNDELLQVSEGIRRTAAEAALRETDGLALELEIAAERSRDGAEREGFALDRVARDLVRRGVPPHRISISLESGLGSGVRLSFFARPVLPPDMAFADQGARP